MNQLCIFFKTLNALLQTGARVNLGAGSEHVPTRHIPMPTLQSLQALFFFCQLRQGEIVFRNPFGNFFHVMAALGQKFDPFLITSTRKHGEQTIGILRRLASGCEHQ